MKILYHAGNIHFQGVAGKNYVIPEGTEGDAVRDTILIMAKHLWDEYYISVMSDQDDTVLEGDSDD